MDGEGGAQFGIEGEERAGIGDAGEAEGGAQARRAGEAVHLPGQVAEHGAHAGIPPAELGGAGRAHDLAGGDDGREDALHVGQLDLHGERLREGQGLAGLDPLEEIAPRGGDGGVARRRGRRRIEREILDGARVDGAAGGDHLGQAGGGDAAAYASPNAASNSRTDAPAMPAGAGSASSGSAAIASRSKMPSRTCARTPAA